MTESSIDGEASSYSSINSVSVKVPPFWPDEPELWFAQLESQFALANITIDSTKYNYVISNLDYKYVTEIKDIIKSPPTVNKYDKIKSELISRLSSSHEQRVRQLMSHEDIGDRKPSQFLRHLQNLAGPNVPDEFVRSIWSSRLPSHVQVIVASQSKCNLDDLAKLADTVNDVITQPQVQEVTAPTSNSEINELRNCIAELTKQVAALSIAARSRSRGRSPRWRQRTRSPSSAPQQDKMCWYHWKFGDKATRCRSPCSYAGNEKYSH